STSFTPFISVLSHGVPPDPLSFPTTTLFRSMQGRFDLATRALEITRGPMEGRRFPDPTTAANAVASFLSGDVEKCDGDTFWRVRSEEHTSELQSRENLVCRLLLEKKNTKLRE